MTAGRQSDWKQVLLRSVVETAIERLTANRASLRHLSSAGDLVCVSHIQQLVSHGVTVLAVLFGPAGTGRAGEGMVQGAEGGRSVWN